ncbi:MAG: fibro-slime domain-containing protein [Firmicutes bacterium]|nr:fibro-slime domain-containing protein [Bacillota bacterium]
MDACYSDKTADVEDPALWDAQFGTTALTKDTWAESLAAVAEQQVGYEESEDNYEVEKDGSHNGYTRYGDFADDKYGSWDTSFVNFCLEYAGIAKANVFPEEESTAKDFVKQFVKDDKENKEYVEDANEQTLEEGNLVVVKGNPENGNDKTDTTLGIVTKVDKEEGTATVVEGDSHDQVEENEYDLDSKNLTQTIPVDKIENDLKEEEASENQTPEGSSDQAEPDADSTQPEGDKAPEAADTNKEEADKTESDQETGNGEAADEENPVGIQYICGITEEHTHGDACYDENGELTCKKEEHQHGFDCLKPAEGEEQPSEEPAEEEQPSEEPAQPDEEEAAAPESGYICGKEEHTHSDACYDDGTYNLSKPLFKLFTNREGEPELICGKEEHQHDDACLPEGEVEKKDEAGNEYFCGQKAHKHDETCLDENNQLACGLPEHEHDDSCLVEQKEEEPEYICGKKEHKHEASCYDEKGELTCKEEEHQHDDSCVKAEEEEPETQLIPIVKQFTQKVGAFNITFDIKGTAEVAAEKTDGNEPGNSDEAVTENAAAGSDESTAPEEEIAADEDGNADLAPASEAKGTAKAGIREVLENVNEAVEESKEAAGNNDAGDTADSKAETGTAGDEESVAGSEESAVAGDTSGIEMEASLLDEDSEAFNKFKEYTEKHRNGGEQFLLQAIKVQATYKGEPLDLSNCKMTATVAANENLAAQMPEGEDGREAEAAFTFMELSNETENVEYLENVTVSQEDLDENNEIMTADVTNTTVGISGENIANTKFTVEYYANLERVVSNDSTKRKVTEGTSYTNELPLIDTSGKKMPQNGKGRYTSPTDNAIKNIYVDNKANSNQGDVITEKKLTEIYRSRECNYYAHPNLNYFNALIDNDNYELKRIWISKKTAVTSGAIVCGTEAHSHNNNCYNDKKQLTCGKDVHKHDAKCYKGSWEIVGETTADGLTTKAVGLKTNSNNLDVYFTNRSLDNQNHENDYVYKYEGRNYIYLHEGATVRLEYDPSTSKPTSGVDFYDYDIGDGYIYSNATDAQNQTNQKNTSTQDGNQYYMHTNRSGINSPDNYQNDGGAKLGFGNANTGSGLQEEKWGTNKETLNRFNRRENHFSTDATTASFSGCTFGLAKSLSQGEIQYSDNVDVPKLFNEEGSVNGKTAHSDYSLQFSRSSDTYTLSAVNKGGTTTNTKNLQRFNHPNDTTQTHYHIWTNNFWPMDTASTYGANGHDMKFGQYSLKDNRKFKGVKKGTFTDEGSFPQSDDGEDHNSYFGMHYTVDFTLPEDYVGPLEYYFFGDDDMWVFLDDELVCDIGGVHSSVGEYVNLWDYIPGGRDGKRTEKESHKLSFFYTERGESGSTCWMQFTLPSVTFNNTTTLKDYGDLRVDKDVFVKEDASGNATPFQEFLGKFEPGELNCSKEEHSHENCTKDENGKLTCGKEAHSHQKNDHEFKFTIKVSDAEGNALPDEYAFEKFNANGESIEANIVLHTGSEFALKDGEYILVKYLPKGAKCEIVEKSDSVVVKDVNYACDTDIEGDIKLDEKGNTIKATDKIEAGEDRARIAVGKIANDESAVTRQVTYTNTFTYYKLPSTGGMGIYWYIISGILLMAGAALIVYKNRCREVLKR